MTAASGGSKGSIDPPADQKVHFFRPTFFFILMNPPIVYFMLKKGTVFDPYKFFNEYIREKSRNPTSS